MTEKSLSFIFSDRKQSSLTETLVSLFGDVTEWKQARCRAIATEQKCFWQHVESLRRRTFLPEHHLEGWWTSHLPERHRCVMAPVGNFNHYNWSDLSPAEICPSGAGLVLTSNISVMNKHPFAVAGLPGSNISPHLCCSYWLTSLLALLEVWEAELFCFCLLLFFLAVPLSSLCVPYLLSKKD